MANLFFSGFITTDSMKKSNKNSVSISCEKNYTAPNLTSLFQQQPNPKVWFDVVWLGLGLFYLKLSSLVNIVFM